VPYRIILSDVLFFLIMLTESSSTQLGRDGYLASSPTGADSNPHSIRRIAAGTDTPAQAARDAIRLGNTQSGSPEGRKGAGRPGQARKAGDRGRPEKPSSSCLRAVWLIHRDSSRHSADTTQLVT
jgi:hypothetical protein